MARRKTAVLLALRYYRRELGRRKRIAVPALLFPALGNICLLYLTPLVVAGLAGRLAEGGEVGVTTVLPAVLTFAGLLLLAEVMWRIGVHCLNRTDGRGIENLYVLGMDELLAKDAAFFHDNFAGSLTKRVLSFATRYEEFVDTMAFSVVANIVPLGFASVVLWRYDPLLVVALVTLIAVTGLVIAPLVRRRQALVDRREAAIARVAGHVADSLTNMATVRAFAAEPREAAEHRSRVAEQRRLAIRSWDYANLRIDMVVAPMSVLTNALGLLLAVGLGGGRLGVEAIVVTFTYFRNATRIMFEFNQIYRRLESSLTEAAQFTELLLHPPTVLDPDSPEPLRHSGADIRFERVRFAHAGAPVLFDGLDLVVPDGTKVGLVGRSGGGKSTLTQLLLRMMDIQGGTIRIGGQDISRLRQADLRGLIAYVPQEPAMFHRTLRENIAFARQAATDAEIHAAADGRARHRVRRHPPRRVRHARRRARGQALRRPAPAGRAGAGDPARRADPAARRGDQCAGLGERDPHPAGAVADHGGPDHPRGGPPAEHGGADGPARRPRPRRDRRAGQPRRAAGPRRRLCPAVGPPVRRVPRRGGARRSQPSVSSAWTGRWSDGNRPSRANGLTPTVRTVTAPRVRIQSIRGPSGTSLW